MNVQAPAALGLKSMAEDPLLYPLGPQPEPFRKDLLGRTLHR